MKERLLLILVFAAMSLAVNAQQISNAGFESWSTSYAPDSFYNSNGLLEPGTVTQSSDAHSGTSSVLLENLYNSTINGVLSAGIGYGTAGQQLWPKGWPLYRPTIKNEVLV